MATINDTWDLATPTGGDSISGGDDRIRELKRAIEERMKNLGLKWPAGTDADSGILRVSADNYVADEFSIYASDESTKQVRVTDTDIELNDDTSVDGDLSCTGTITEGGTEVVTQDQKRIVVLQQEIDSFDGFPPTESLRLSFPNGIASGTMIRFFAILDGRTSDASWTVSWTATAFSDGSALDNDTYSSSGATELQTTSVSFTQAQGITVAFTNSDIVADRVNMGVVLELDY